MKGKGKNLMAKFMKADAKQDKALMDKLAPKGKGKATKGEEPGKKGKGQGRSGKAKY